MTHTDKAAWRKVPCNGCTICCQKDAIRILPGDNVSLYQTVPHKLYPRTQLMLDHKPNGDCIYLGDDGCTIHDHSPIMCKEMDCRNISKKVNKRDAERSGLLRIWNKGRSMA